MAVNRWDGPLAARLVVATMLSACIALGLASRASAAAQQQTFFSDGITENLCNGETVHFAGATHIVFNQTTTVSGVFNGVANEAMRFTGMGSFGNEYVGGQTADLVVHVAAGSEETVPILLKVVGKGGVPNFVLHVLFHMTFDANGNLVVSADHFASTCET